MSKLEKKKEDMARKLHVKHEGKATKFSRSHGVEDGKPVMRLRGHQTIGSDMYRQMGKFK